MKHWTQSKTIWYNVATGAAVLTAILGGYGVDPNMELVNKAVELNTLLAPVVNIFLRRVTTEAIG